MLFLFFNNLDSKTLMEIAFAFFSLFSISTSDEQRMEAEGRQVQFLKITVLRIPISCTVLVMSYAHHCYYLLAMIAVIHCNVDLRCYYNHICISCSIGNE